MRVAVMCVFALALACKRHVEPAQAEDAAKKAAFVHATAQSAEPLPADAIGVWVGVDGVRASVDGPLVGLFYRDGAAPGEPTSLPYGMDTSALEPALEKIGKQVDAA